MEYSCTSEENNTYKLIELESYLPSLNPFNFSGSFNLTQICGDNLSIRFTHLTSSENIQIYLNNLSVYGTRTKKIAIKSDDDIHDAQPLWIVGVGIIITGSISIYFFLGKQFNQRVKCL